MCATVIQAHSPSRVEVTEKIAVTSQTWGDMVFTGFAEPLFIPPKSSESNSRVA